MKTAVKTLFQINGNQSKNRFRYLTKTILCFMLLFASSLHAQDPAQYGTPFAGVPYKMDANIYQLNFREYTPQRTIVAAKNNMQRLKDLGINVIYLMPFTTVTTDPTKGIDKSPYCIKDLKGVDPSLGTLQDIRDYVAQAHTLGMAVIFDFVPNQTAWDHPWITQHPDWYAKDASGAIRSPDAGAPGSPFLFTDVAELNLTNPTVVNAMIDATRYWIFAANFDGVRLDWADKAGQAFNNTFVSNMRGITSHNLLLLAEGSNEGSTSQCNTCGDNQPGAHWAQGWDFIYGTNFYWNVMKKVWKGGEPAKNLDNVTNVMVNGVSLGEYGSGTFAGSPNSTQLVARFLSSHDNYNEDGSPFVGNGNASLGGKNAVMSAFAVIAYHRGVPFIYNGLDVGNTNPLPYPWRTGTINWTQDLTVYTEMQKMLSVRNASVALRRGQPTSYIDPANTNPDVIAFTKSFNTEKVVVLVNVRNSNKTFTIPAGMAGSYSNAFAPGGASVSLISGATVSLAPYQYLVYTNANVPIVAVTGVSTSPTSASVRAGLKTQLSASITPSNATNQGVTWSSSNTSVATVDSNGLVSGLVAGTASITVRTNDGAKTSSASITVTPGTAFTVNFFKPANWGTNIRIYHWSALPTGSLADASWPGVLMTNNNDGWYSYTFTNVESTNIIFNDGSGDVNKTVDLNRNKNGWYANGVWYDTKPGTTSVSVTGVTLTPTTATLNKGATLQLNPTVAPASATNKNITYNSSNTAVATVNASGLVNALASGTATITVTTQDGAKTATCAVTVNNVIVPTGNYYTIKNRWKGTYLYDAGNSVGYGATVANNNYKWEKITIDANYFWLKNVGTGELMHIENQTGSVQCSAGNLDWWSAQWSQNNVDGTYIKIRNRWQTGNIVHVENQTGSAQYNNVQEGWYSAQWQLTPTTSTAKVGLEGSLQQQSNLLSLNVYPNPVTEKEFNLELSGLKDGETATVNVFDFNGKKVLNTKANLSTKINHNFASGLYFINVSSNGQSLTKKLIVK